MDPNNTPSRAKARTQAGQKYIPFNHDPANVGTRTGQPMPSNVRRDSMGFENISEFFESPDGITTRTDALTTRTTATGASGMTSVRRSYTSRRTEVEEGSGEMTMDIETPTHRARPNGNRASERLDRPASDDDEDNYNFDRPPPLNLPSASKRQGSQRSAAREDDEESSREALRRGVSSSRRRSAQPGALSDEADQVFGADASLASAGGLGGNDDFQVDDGGFDDADGNDYDGGGDDDGYQDEAQQDALDVDQAIGLAPDEDDEEQMPRTTTSKGKAKGKGRGKANVLSDKTNKRRVATTGSESEAERPVQKRARTARAMSVEQTAIRRPADEENTNSYLRTKRERRKPLEYWRGERPVLTRKVDADGKLAPTYVVAEWLEVPKEEPEPLAARRAKTAGKGRGRSASVKPGMAKIAEEVEDYGDWDDGTEPSGVVADHYTKKDIIRKIAVTHKHVRLASVFNQTFEYEKIFGEQDFFAAGIFHIAVEGEKLSKDSRDNCYVFYVIKGAVEVTIHRTKFVMAQGGQFMVPRSNVYAIKNIATEPARLFFAQARRLKAEVFDGREDSAMPTERRAEPAAPSDDDEDEEPARPAPRKKGRPTVR